MPFTDQDTSEIHEWIKKDDSKVGRITADTPLAMNKQVMKIVRDAVQDMEEEAKLTIIYVCNTTLEAELLDRQLKDKEFRGGKIGEQSVVSKAGHAMGAVVLLSYARLRELLDARASSFPNRVVVICEQEPASNMDAWIARGQFALLARETLVRRYGYNVKLLGLTYREHRGGDWLEHPHHVMSSLPPSGFRDLSLDLTDMYTMGSRKPPAKWNARGEGAMETVAADAAAVLKKNKHVVVYGPCEETMLFWSLVGEASGSDVPLHDKFATGLERDTELDRHTMFMMATGDETPGHILAIEPASFATALPLTRVGMVVSIVTTIARRVYDNLLHLVVSSPEAQSNRSIASQRFTGRRRDGPEAPEPTPIVEIVDLDKNSTVPRFDVFIQQGTHDPLGECFAMVAAYPAKALNLLPIFDAVDDTRDLAVRLRAMGLLADQGHGFLLTGKGRRARGLMDEEESLTIEAATAMAGIDLDCMGDKVARSIVRICFMKDMYLSFVEMSAMELESDAAFSSFLQFATNTLVQGGPGREYVDLGLIWLTWATFESISYKIRVQGANLPENILPGQNWPFRITAAGLKKAMQKLASWELLLGLDPLSQGERDVWNTPLHLGELTMVEREIAKANYSTVSGIPISMNRDGQVYKWDLTAVWLRTNKTGRIQGEFDEYLYAYRRALIKDIQVPASQGHFSIGGLPLSISTEEGRTCVSGVMWFDYKVIKSLMGDLNAEDADPRVRAVAMRT